MSATETRSTKPSPVPLPTEAIPVFEGAQPVPPPCSGERAPTAPTAPAPWLQIPAPRYNSFYFFNFMTRESKWVNPTPWTSYFCPSCNIYHYLNSETQEITFTNPLAPPEPEGFTAPAVELSPFASKLGTNYCPEEEEVLEIRNHLAAPFSSMTTLNRRADEFEYGRRDLYQQLQAVYTYVQAHMALLTPVRRLPRDIIQEIFIACLPEDRNCVMSALEAPVLLGQVCSSWRTISLSTPRLWARLHIVEPLLPREPSVSKQLLHAEKHAQRIETTKAWLARSGECPLSLSFSSESSQWGAEGVDAPNIFFQVLVLFARRWQDIRLVASPGALMHLSCLREDDVPMLKSLDIRELRPPTEFNAVTPWEYFGLLSSPKMSSFTIHGGFQVASLLPLPWGSLTSLTIFGWGSSDRLNRHRALEILRKSPRLRVANLGITDEDGVSAPAVGECDTALELSDLHSLRIVCDPWIFIDNRLFSHLNLPKLRNLRVDIRSPEAVPADIYLFPFLRASPQLQNLEINFHRFSKRQLIDLFAALPSTIQELRLLDSPDGSLGENTPDDHTLAALIPTPDRPLDECCPNLAVFDITYSVDVSDEALLRFITARMAVQPAALRRVHIRFDRLRQLDICANLQLFLDSGLEVALEYNDDRPVDLSPWRGVEQDLV